MWIFSSHILHFQTDFHWKQFQTISQPTNTHHSSKNTLSSRKKRLDWNIETKNPATDSGVTARRVCGLILLKSSVLQLSCRTDFNCFCISGRSTCSEKTNLWPPAQRPLPKSSQPTWRLGLTLMWCGGWTESGCRGPRRGRWSFVDILPRNQVYKRMNKTKRISAWERKEKPTKNKKQNEEKQQENMIWQRAAVPSKV